MLELNIGQDSEEIVVTLKELATLANPNYLFVFTHVTTKAVVAFVAGADQSDYPERTNQFNINTDALFGLKPPGEWHYTAYEQVSAVNVNPVLALGIVEYGKMRLYRENEFEYTQYDEPVTYKAYNG